MKIPMLIWEGGLETESGYISRTVYRIVCNVGEQPIVERQSEDALGVSSWVPADNLDSGKLGRLFSRAFVELATKIKRLESYNDAKFSITPKPLLD